MKQHMLFAALIVLAGATPSVADTYAAQDPFGGGVGPVVHASTEAEARVLAIQACRRISGICADRPVSGKVGVFTLFVTTCCKIDSVARCHAVGVAEDEDAGREKAYNASLKAFVDAGLSISNCWRHRTYSVRTGARLRD